MGFQDVRVPGGDRDDRDVLSGHRPIKSFQLEGTLHSTFILTDVVSSDFTNLLYVEL